MIFKQISKISRALDIFWKAMTFNLSNWIYGTSMIKMRDVLLPFKNFYLMVKLDSCWTVKSEQKFFPNCSFIWNNVCSKCRVILRGKKPGSDYCIQHIFPYMNSSPESASVAFPSAGRICRKEWQVIAVPSCHTSASKALRSDRSFCCG